MGGGESPIDDLTSESHDQFPGAPVSRSRHDAAVACRHAEEGGMTVVNQEQEAVGAGSCIGYALQGVTLAQGHDGVAGELASGIETEAYVTGEGDEAVGGDAAEGARPELRGDIAARRAQTQQRPLALQTGGYIGSCFQRKVELVFVYLFASGEKEGATACQPAEQRQPKNPQQPRI